MLMLHSTRTFYGTVEQRPRGLAAAASRRAPRRPPAASAAASSSAPDVAQLASVAVRSGRFLLEKADVDAAKSRFSVDDEALLLALLPPARLLARPPISRFQVGATALGASGRVFLGCNVELPGLPLSQSIHAEQFALATARLAGEKSLEALAVTAMPCGHCRQFMQELQHSAALRCLVPDAAPAVHRLQLGGMLPHAFGPSDLLGGGHAFLLSQRHNFIKWAPAGAPVAPRSEHAAPAAMTELAYSAFAAAQGSYAPYSGCPAGVALLTRQGGIFAGGVLESAAYNPTLPPLQAALVAAVAGGVGDWAEVVEAVLVEKEGAMVSQAAMAALVLAHIAPNARLTVMHAESVL